MALARGQVALEISLHGRLRLVFAAKRKPVGGRVTLERAQPRAVPAGSCGGACGLGRTLYARPPGTRHQTRCMLPPTSLAGMLASRCPPPPPDSPADRSHRYGAPSSPDTPPRGRPTGTTERVGFDEE
eukprot:scaffold8182_cov229-Prasinococcus_capsulatus_cf.AAC.1